MRSYSEESHDTGSSSRPSTANTLRSEPKSPAESSKERDIQLQAEDKRTVQNELDKYTSAGLASSESADLIFFWEVSTTALHSHLYVHQLKDYRMFATSIPYYSALQWMFCLCRRQLFLANGFSP